MLDIHNLQVSHGHLQVVWDLSLHVGEGEIVTLIGPNGAGKTTTVETIFGLNPKAKGEILFCGEEILGMRPYAIVRKGISLVPEKRELFPKMTVLENLKLGAYLKGDEANFGHIFSLFPLLHEREHQLAGTLSGGEQQMLAIARSLMSDPALLVLDEPSLGLSPLLVESVLETVKVLNENGLTILLLEQNTLHALEISHRGYVLENGRIILEGDSGDLLENDHIKSAFLGM